VAPEALAYVNRLSDLLFVMARAANLRAGGREIPWVPAK
jgi:cob(I)alamin adenosyltransferase